MAVGFLQRWASRRECDKHRSRSLCDPPYPQKGVRHHLVQHIHHWRGYTGHKYKMDVFGRQSYKLYATVAGVRTAAAYRWWNLLEGGTGKLSGVKEILDNVTVLLVIWCIVCQISCIVPLRPVPSAIFFNLKMYFSGRFVILDILRIDKTLIQQDQIEATTEKHIHYHATLQV